jgi:hypothetical protein
VAWTKGRQARLEAELHRLSHLSDCPRIAYAKDFIKYI